MTSEGTPIDYADFYDAFHALALSKDRDSVSDFKIIDPQNLVINYLAEDYTIFTVDNRYIEAFEEKKSIFNCTWVEQWLTSCYRTRQLSKAEIVSNKMIMSYHEKKALDKYQETSNIMFVWFNMKVYSFRYFWRMCKSRITNRKVIFWKQDLQRG